FIHNLYSGSNGCPYGCLGGGDCVDACQFDAMYMDKETGLPVIIQDKCIACGACVKACPRKIIELRKKGKKDRRIFVSCINREKGAVAKKNCEAACIGCGKCVKECKFEAITLENNLAYIDFEKCTLCRKCVESCPTHSIWEVNFPERKKKEADSPAEEIVTN
ncbi:MAG: 4Fe-4S binding protein, partial [Bacteroidales bacterium]